MSKVTVDRRLYLTDDGGLVEHGDPDAAFLWASEGRQVDADDAAAVGYTPASSDPDGDTDGSGDVDDVDPDDTVEAPAHECDVCGFVAKSAGGLGAHRRTHE